MNTIIAKIIEINTLQNLNIVTFEFKTNQLTMMSLDLSDDIKVGSTVELVVNPAHVALSKNFTGEISYANQLSATIKSIENGQLLSSIELSFFDTVLDSIITLNSSKKMNLKVGDEVTAFIKSSEISIFKVLT